MILMSCSIVVIVFIIIFITYNKNKENENNIGIDNEYMNEGKSINIFKFILLSIPVFIAMYMVIGILSMIIISSFAFADSGAWAYGIIAGFIGSIILTPIVVYKLIKEEN